MGGAEVPNPTTTAPTTIDLRSSESPVVERLSASFRTGVVLGSPIRSAADLRVRAVWVATAGLSAICILCALLLAASGSLKALRVGGGSTVPMLLLAAMIIVVLGAVGALFMKVRVATTEESNSESAEAVGAPAQRGNDVLVRRFQQIAINQAHSSFWHGQIAIAFALSLLLCGSCVVFLSETLSGRVVVGSLTALGSGYSAFLASTFLDARNRAIDQLNRSHAIPLAKDLIFLADKLASKVKDGQSEDAVRAEIVRKTLAGVDSVMSSSLTSGSTASEVGAGGRLGRGRRRIRPTSRAATPPVAESSRDD